MAILLLDDGAEATMDGSRRRFLTIMGKGFIVLGPGIVGLPLGACLRDPEYRALAELGPDLLEDSRVAEMTPAEIDAFIREVDARAREVREDSTGADAGGIAADAGPEADSSTAADVKPEVPPGQHVVESLPVLGTNPNPRSLQEWRFHVRGAVEEELEFTWEEFQKLPAVDQVIDFHCVTGWTVLNLPTRGVPVKSLLALAQPTAAAGFVVFDCEHGYTTNIDLAEAMKDNVHIELFLWGAPLPDKYGGPARGRVPDRYGYKSGKWVTGLRVLAADEPGFWETKGYSNTADPWTEDRYA